MALQDYDYEGSNDIDPATGQPRTQVNNPSNIGVGTGIAGPAASPWDKNARNALRDAWMSGGGGDPQNFFNTNPAATAYKDQFSLDGDVLRMNPTIDDKYGSMGQEVIDISQDYGPGGLNKAAWTGIGPGSGGTGNNVYPNGIPGSSGSVDANGSRISSPGGSAGSFSSQSGYQPGGYTYDGQRSGMSDQSSALYNLLMQRATQGLDVSPDDPIIKGQTDAYGAQQQRAMRNYLSSNAERVGPNANVGAETRSAAEQVGQSTGAFEAQLMQQELNSRRQEIQQALSGAAGFLTAQEQMQLQEELTKLELAQRQYQFSSSQGQQESQFGRSLEEQALNRTQNLAQRAYEFDTPSF